jgi:hypothetical protein
MSPSSTPRTPPCLFCPRQGYAAFEVGPFQMMWENSWPWRDAGAIHVAGLNNGQGFNGPMGPSHRAQIPPLLAPIIATEEGATYTYWGSGVDYGARDPTLQNVHMGVGMGAACGGV